MSQQVFFVDASVAGSDELKSALELSIGEGSKVFVLENNSDAFQQMDAALESLGEVQVDAVHIYAHGAEGSVTLGGKTVDQAALDESAAILDKIGKYLTEDGDILLYSCNTAKGAAGQSFIQRLAALTRADVAASMDVTGLSGNWTLEYATGPVEAASRNLPGYVGDLENKPAWVDDTVNWGTVIGSGNAAKKVGGSVTGDKLYDRTEYNDSLSGHDGNDIYYITNTGTRAYEDPNEGDDTLVSRVADYNLSLSDFEDVKTSIEHIVLEAQDGFEEQSFTGSAVDQTITGNALNNKLVGMGGADSLDGGDGDDSLDGGWGSLGENVQDDLTAADTMVGGKGNDTYVVRNAKQVVTEKAKEGTDEVFSFIDYTLGANVENLTLLTGALKGTGNADANVLKGNNLSNYLSGLGGNDTLHGGKQGANEVDTLDGGAGNDTYYVYRGLTYAAGVLTNGDIIRDSAGKDTIISSVDYDLTNAADVEELQLVGLADSGTGNKLNNRIVGNETVGSTLDGYAGSNTLVGGYGNDTFIMRSTGDKIEDLGGSDTVQSYVTVNLASSKAAIENIELQDVVDPAVLAKNKNANNINATAGKSVATRLVGNLGNNQLTGGDMGDVLYGGAGGKDTLTGGKGNDLYVVTSADVTVKEGATDAADSVVASVDYALGAKSNVENLYLANGARQGTGNEQANRIEALAADTDYAGVALVAVSTTANDKLVLDGGKNTAGLQGDTLVGAVTGNTQFYTYNANDSIEAAGTGNVIVISYDVTGAVGNAQSASAATDDDWVAYFNARGVSLSTASVSFVYRGNPAAMKAKDPGRTIIAQAGQTYLVGTNGKDSITAAANTATTIDGGTGADNMVGSSEADTFYVDDVKDYVNGNGGNDTVYSTVSVDLGAAKPDAVKAKFAATSTNTQIDNERVVRVELTGTAAVNAAGQANGSTTLVGNAKGNVLVGGTKNDSLDGGEGSDSMYGGGGDNVFVVDNAGDRVFTNGAVTDKNTIEVKGVNLKLSDVKKYNETAKFTYSVTTLKHAAGDTTALKLDGIEDRDEIIDASGAFDPTYTGKGDTIDGYGGVDTIIGSRGNDLVYYHGTYNLGSVDGGGGMDTLMVRGGLRLAADTLPAYADPNSDQYSMDYRVLSTFAAVVADKDWGGKVPAGAHSIIDYSQLTNDRQAAMGLTGTQGISITGNAYDMEFIGSKFDDYIATGGGVDSVKAGAGADTIELVTSANAKAFSAGTVDGGEGEDTLILGSGADKVVLSDGATTGVVVINTATAIKNGTTTLDTKVTATSIEEISGGAGNDVIDATLTKNGVTLSGGAGTNTLYGGAGSDTFVLRDGTDTIWTDGNPKGTDGKGAGYDNSVVSHDVIKLTKDAAGKTFTIKDFNAGLDAVDWDELKAMGWTKDDPKQSGTTATLTLTDPENAKNKITVKFENTVGKDIKFESTTEVDASQSFADNTAKVNLLLTADALTVAATRFADRVTVAEGKTATAVYGNDGDDSMSGEGVLYGGSGNDSMVGNGELYGDSLDATGIADADTVAVTTAGNDTLVATALTDGSKLITGNGDNLVRIEGVAADQSANTAIITGGDGTNDTLVLASAAALNLSGAEIAAGTIDEALVGKDGEQSKALAANSIAMAGNAVKLTMTKMDSISGSAGADYIVAGTEALKYTTGGGSDSVTGGAGDDTVVVTTLVDGTSIDLKAGAGEAGSEKDHIKIEAVTAGPAEDVADGVTLKATDILSLKFENAAKVDLQTGTIEMGGNKVSKVTIEADKLHLNGSEGADAITAGDEALGYETHGGADTVIGSNASDTIIVNTLMDKVSISGNGGADLISVGKLDTKGTATISGGAGGTATLSFSRVSASTDTLTLNIKGNNSSVVLGPDKNTATATVNLKGMDGVTGFEGGNVRKNYFYVDSLTAGMALTGAGGENAFHVEDFENGAAVTITGGTGENEALAFRTAASGKSIDLDFNANTVSLGTRGTDGNLQDAKTMSLANVTEIDEYRGTSEADKVTGKAGTALRYSTHGGADSVTGGNASSRINVSDLVAGVQVSTGGTVIVAKTSKIDPKTQSMASLRGTALQFTAATTLEATSVSGAYHIQEGTGGKAHAYLDDFKEYAGSEGSDKFSFVTLDDGTAYYMGGGDEDRLLFHDVVNGAAVTLSGGTKTEPATGNAKLSLDADDDAAVAMTLTANGEVSTIKIGENSATAKISGFTSFKGHDGVDTFTIDSLADGMTFDGKDGGTDVFTINGLAADSITATIKSGAFKDSTEPTPKNGTLSFAGASQAVELTLGTKDGKTPTTVTLGTDSAAKTATLNLTNIREFQGSASAANTFNVGTLKSADYVLVGGSDAAGDTVSFAGLDSVPVNLTKNGGVVNAGTVGTFHVSGIEKYVGTKGADTMSVDLLNDKLTLDGGAGGADVFNVNGLVEGGASITNAISSGAAGGTLNFAGLRQGITAVVSEEEKTWTLNTAQFTLESITGGTKVTAGATYKLDGQSDKITGNEIITQNIGTITGADSVANTFDVSALGSGEYALAGSTETDTVSFASRTAGNNVAASLAGNALTVDGGPMLTLTSIEKFVGTAEADSFTVDSLKAGMVLDGGTNGKDAFSVAALAADSMSATVKSGAAGGTLSFADATEAVELTLTTADGDKKATNTAKVGSKTATLSVQNIGTYVGAADSVATTFNVGTLASGAYTLTGGAKVDSVSFANKVVEEATAAGVTATLAGDTLTVGTSGPTLNLNNIEQLVGTKGVDTFTVDSLAGGMVLNGGEDGKDVFNVKALAGDNISATVKSGGDGGKLSFTEAGAAVTLTLGTTNSVKVGADKTATLTLEKISVFEGASADHVNTFNVGTLASGAYSLTGGSSTADVVSFADMEEAQGAGITAAYTSATGVFAVTDGPSLTLTGIEKFTGTKGKDTITVDSLGAAGKLGVLDGGNGGADVFKVAEFATGVTAATIASGGDGGELSFENAGENVALTLNLDTAKTAKLGEGEAVSLTLTNIGTIKGTASVDEFQLGTIGENLAKKMGGDSTTQTSLTFNGGSGGADNFVVTDVADTYSATLVSGAVNGALTLGGTAAHTLTVTTANNVTTAAFGDDKGSLTLQNISSITDTSNAASTFDLQSAGGVIKTITGGTAADTYKLNKADGTTVADTDKTKADTIQLFGFTTEGAGTELAFTTDGDGKYIFTNLKFSYSADGKLTVKNGENTYLTFNIGTGDPSEGVKDSLEIMNQAGTGSLFADLGDTSALKDCAGFDLSGFKGTTAIAEDAVKFTYSDNKLSLSA